MLALSLRRYWPAWLVFAVILVHGATIGLTDDEAYYWVLAQKPAMGYAFHPPAVALCIAFSLKLFGWLIGTHSVALVRLPAASCAGILVALGMHWIDRAGGGQRSYTRGALALVSLVGFFSLSWMMVPDLPLFVGWTLAFVATWEICFGEHARRQYVYLAAGVMLAILSKYSGVLGAGSAGIAITLWAPRERRWRGLLSVVLGGALAAIPILWWNATHEWASILYQIRERHGDAQISWIRYIRFWAVEALLSGPGLLSFLILTTVQLIRKRGALDRPLRYAWVWLTPGAAIFFTQPLWADFKPHWALIVWWPAALAFGWAWSSGKLDRLARVQAFYGVGFGALVLLSCHLPLGSWTMSHINSQVPINPLLDVTNDLYGWSDLPQALVQSQGPSALRLPVIGSRYQTAAQAAFAMGEGSRVTLLPRDLKAMDEWPDLHVSEGQGPAWPRLTTPVYFVGDNRYDAGPEFPGAKCTQVVSYDKMRAGLLAKRLLVWKCEPASLQP